MIALLRSYLHVITTAELGFYGMGSVEDEDNTMNLVLIPTLIFTGKRLFNCLKNEIMNLGYESICFYLSLIKEYLFADVIENFTKTKFFVP